MSKIIIIDTESDECQVCKGTGKASKGLMNSLTKIGGSKPKCEICGGTGKKIKR